MTPYFAQLEQALLTGEPLDEAIGAYFNEARNQTSAECTEMLAALDGLLQRPQSLERLASIGLLAGALVEIGADGDRFPKTVFDLLLRELESIPTDPEQAEDFEFADGYYELERAAMACLSRSAERRAKLPQKELLRKALRRYSDNYSFLGKMLYVLDDEPFLVFEPNHRRGFRIRISGIADNFQLHALLREKLGGAGPDQIDVGKSSLPSEWVSSNWQLSMWLGIGTDPAKFDGTAWIWNEGVPADIPICEQLGVRVILVQVGGMARSWGAGRIFEGMIGELVVEEVLSAEEVDRHLGILREALPAAQ